MSIGNLAWVVLLECLRAEDWDTAWALVNLVVQRRLVDPLCSDRPPEQRPTFRLIEPLAASYEAVDQVFSRLVLGPDVARCSCGATYIAAQWEGLELVGSIDDRAEGGKLLEQRNCVCGSTMTRELEP